MIPASSDGNELEFGKEWSTCFIGVRSPIYIVSCTLIFACVTTEQVPKFSRALVLNISLEEWSMFSGLSARRSKLGMPSLSWLCFLGDYFYLIRIYIPGCSSYLWSISSTMVSSLQFGVASSCLSKAFTEFAVELSLLSFYKRMPFLMSTSIFIPLVFFVSLVGEKSRI